jgi:protein tyrosine/serine phosphatase
VHPSLLDDILRDHNIGLIISLNNDADDPHFQDEVRLASEMGIRRLVLPLNGNGTGDPDLYVTALAEMKRAYDAKTPVYLHCSAGAQRSGVAFAMWRLLFENVSADAVYEELLQYQHDPLRNGALIPYLNKHLPYVANELHKAGVLKHVPEPLPIVLP